MPPESVPSYLRRRGGNQRLLRGKRHRTFQLRRIVTVTHAVTVHHIQDDFPARRAVVPSCTPIQRLPCVTRICGFHRRYILVNMVFPRGVVKPVSIPTTMHCTPKRSARRVSALGQPARRGVDRDLIRPERNFGGVVQCDRTAAALHKAECRSLGNARHPAFIDYAAIAGGGNVIDTSSSAPSSA